jgi:hypothetical protein
MVFLSGGRDKLRKQLITSAMGDSVSEAEGANSNRKRFSNGITGDA